MRSPVEVLFRSVWVALLGLVVMAGGTARAAEPDVPAVLSSGFAAYKQDGAAAAIDAWLAGSPLAGDKAAQSQAAALLGVEAYFGKFQGWDVIRSYRISPSSTLTFTEARFEKGVAFMRFLTFQTGGKESVTQFFFHTQPEQILPNGLLYPGS